jgi:hypothetical protein
MNKGCGAGAARIRIILVEFLIFLLTFTKAVCEVFKKKYDNVIMFI